MLFFRVQIKQEKKKKNQPRKLETFGTNSVQLPFTQIMNYIPRDRLAQRITASNSRLDWRFSLNQYTCNVWFYSRLTCRLFFLCPIPNIKLLKQLTTYQQVAISQKKSGIEWIIFYNYRHKAQEGYYVLVVLCTADTKVSE